MESSPTVSRTTRLSSSSISEEHQHRASCIRSHLKHQLLFRPEPTLLSSDVQRENADMAQGPSATSRISPGKKTHTNDLEHEVARVLNGMKHDTVLITSKPSSLPEFHQTVINPAACILVKHSQQKRGQIDILVQSSTDRNHSKKNGSLKLPGCSPGNLRSVHVSHSAPRGLVRHSCGENFQCYNCRSKLNTKSPLWRLNARSDKVLHWERERAVKRKCDEERRVEYWNCCDEEKKKECVRMETLKKVETDKVEKVNRVEETRKKMRGEEKKEDRKTGMEEEG